MEATIVQPLGVRVEIRGERKGVIVILDSFHVNRVYFEGAKEVFNDIHMSEEALYHSGPFNIICMDCIGDMHIIDDFFGFDLEEKDFEESI